ncbi:MAG: hypothetical protein EOL89_04615 [Actinobacteria bacterium]|nr:hypothetical protein [Actinomycetota bacterium]
MREHDENAPEGTTPETEGQEQTGEGVALSPYDSDLEAPATEAEPEPYRLDDSPGYDAPQEAEADEPAPTETTPATASPESPAPAAETSPDQAVVHDEDDDVAARWSAAAAGTAGAAAAGAAGAAATRTDAPPADTAVRRSSLMPQQQAPSNEPRRLMTDTQADERAERYAPEADADLFAGAAHDKVPSRAGAHWWGILATLLLTPVAWYLLSDAGARMTLPAENQWESGVLNLAALGELLAGILVLAVILLAARASSLGAFIVGSLVAIIGGAFVLFPALTQEFLEPYLQWLRDYNDFGGNIAHHLVADGSTGRILVAGIALILVGFVSHSARRRGRREQTIREAIERRKAGVS